MMPYELKLIKNELQFGDIATIARECNVSVMTVHNALKGIAITATAKMVIEHAKVIIEQRKNRISDLQLKKQKPKTNKKQDEQQHNTPSL